MLGAFGNCDCCCYYRGNFLGMLLSYAVVFSITVLGTLISPCFASSSTCKSSPSSSFSSIWFCTMLFWSRWGFSYPLPKRLDRSSSWSSSLSSCFLCSSFLKTHVSVWRWSLLKLSCGLARSAVLTISMLRASVRLLLQVFIRLLLLRRRCVVFLDFLFHSRIIYYNSRSDH